MAEEIESQSASGLLWAAWRDHAVMDRLPDDCLPTTRAQGYAVQKHIEAHSNTPLYGWKVAATSVAGGSLHPSIEVPDSRYVDFVTAGEAQLIADNACAHEFVEGPMAPDTWRDMDLAAHPAHATVDGSARRYERSGSGAAVLGDPRDALVWLVNELSSLDIVLRAGQIVTTGACIAPLEVVPGDQVRADFGVLGSVDVRFEE